MEKYQVFCQPLEIDVLWLVLGVLGLQKSRTNMWVKYMQSLVSIGVLALELCTDFGQYIFLVAKQTMRLCIGHFVKK